MGFLLQLVQEKDGPDQRTGGWSRSCRDVGDWTPGEGQSAHKAWADRFSSSDGECKAADVCDKMCPKNQAFFKSQRLLHRMQLVAGKLEMFGASDAAQATEKIARAALMATITELILVLRVSKSQSSINDTRVGPRQNAGSSVVWLRWTALSKRTRWRRKKGRREKSIKNFGH